MSRLLSMMFACSIAFFITSCAGGGSSSAGSTIPTVAQNVAGSHAWTAALLTAPNGPRYVAVKLPANFVPTAIMRDGHIPGSVGKDAAIYFRHQVTILGSFRNEYAVATSVNSHGDAVGFSTAGTLQTLDVPGRALLFSGGTIRELPGLAGTDFSDARAIDDRGDIYGGSGSKSNDSGPRSLTLVRFSRTGGATAITRPTVFNDESDESYIGINRSGNFTVTRAGDGFHPDRGFVGHGLTVVPVIESSNSTAAALNDDGEVTGGIALAHQPPHQEPRETAYIHDEDGTRYLPFLPSAVRAFPSGINNRGDVVGSSSNDTAGTIFVYTHHTIYDINALLPSPLAFGFVLGGLSDKGAFVAGTRTANYIVKPVN
ncbi:MAG: hypothetical protein ABI282_09420 [Candidatus Baltobacteraceae bacterium]